MQEGKLETPAPSGGSQGVLRDKQLSSNAFIHLDLHA